MNKDKDIMPSIEYDVYEHIEDDVEKIQVRPGMYIGYLGNDGALHLTKEIINNSIDEAINVRSNCDYIEIILDENENVVSIEDNGRGIKPEKIVEICTNLQAGTKLRRNSGSTAGENGTGLTACNALSRYFKVTSFSGYEQHSVTFSKGKIIEELSKKNLTKYKTGTRIMMEPDPEFLQGDCNIIATELIKWVERMVYLLPKGLRIKLSIKHLNAVRFVAKVYENKNGLIDLVKNEIGDDMLHQPISFSAECVDNELILGEDVSRNLSINLVFSYNRSNNELRTISFCNFVETVDGGVHLDTVKNTLTSYLLKKTKESLSEREAKKLSILPQDVIQGLFLVVYLSTDMNPGFNSQVKAKVTNEALVKIIKDLTNKVLNESDLSSSKEMKVIIDRIKLNARARIESMKAKNAVVKDKLKSFDEHMMDNFVPANNKGKGDYRELFIIEGDSALGTARSGRFDNDTQALYALRGVPKNAFKSKLSDVLSNKAFLTLVKILGCNIGERFNIDNLKYDKIIIMTDSDSDGYNIASMICAFFIMHMPEIITSGRLYKASAPLYKLKNSSRQFVLSKREYVELFEKQIEKNLSITPVKEKTPMKKKEMNEFLYINRDYVEDLSRVANAFPIDPIILEFLIYFLGKKDFQSKFKKKFPELRIIHENGHDIVEGVFNNKYQILVLDESFYHKIIDLKDHIENTNNDEIFFHVREKSTGKLITIDRSPVLSLYELLSISHKYKPVVLNRFKGLGELDDTELKQTTLSPENRILIRLTTKDIQNDLKKFEILHGDDIEGRKSLIENFKVRREDLDN